MNRGLAEMAWVQQAASPSCVEGTTSRISAMYGGRDS